MIWRPGNSNDTYTRANGMVRPPVPRTRWERFLSLFRFLRIWDGDSKYSVRKK